MYIFEIEIIHIGIYTYDIGAYKIALCRFKIQTEIRYTI